MAAFSFQSRFVLPIEAGVKRQTIRKPRRHLGSHGKVGGPITLMTGSRFKPRRIGASTVAGVFRMTMRFDFNEVLLVDAATLHHERIRRRGLDDFARRDGFSDWGDMRGFWATHHPGTDVFLGIMTTWGDLT